MLRDGTDAWNSFTYTAAAPFLFRMLHFQLVFPMYTSDMLSRKAISKKIKCDTVPALYKFRLNETAGDPVPFFHNHPALGLA